MSDDEAICMCGHHYEEHAESFECEVEDCDCAHFEANEEAWLA